MSDLAGLLRGARKDARLSLQDLAARTKIKVSTLEAIERGDFTRLPGGIFTRGFLRAWAREVGLDPDSVVRDYSAQYESLPASELPAPALAVRDPLLSEPTAAHRLWRPFTAGVAFLVFVLLMARDRPDSSVTDARPVATTGTGTAKPAGNSGAPPPADRLSPVGLRVTIHATGVLWIEATADGRRLVYRLMQPEEREAVDAREEILLRVGDASVIEYSINGKPGRVLGPPGAVRNIRITPANYDALLR